METAVLIAAILIAGFSCPAMMWWQCRRGRESACCASLGDRNDDAAELEELQRSQAVLLARLAELQGDERTTTGHNARDDKALA